MKPLLCAFLLAMLVPCISVAQTIQTGYAVLTPISGTGSGLSVTETFGEQVGANFFQASVIGSPLVTLTNVIVTVDISAGIDTGVALVNPNNTPATVTLTLGNSQGATVDTRTMTLGARQQISNFVSQLFSGVPAIGSPLTGLLFISSPVPIGVLGLSFNGFSFTSLPVASQLPIASVSEAAFTGTLTPGITATSNSTATTIVGTTTVGTTAVPSTITQVPATFPTLVGQQTGLTTTTPITGIVPVPTVPTVPVIPITGTVVIGQTGVVTTPSTTTTTVISNVITFPQISVGIGGPGALLLPQVAAGAGWVSQIAIANTSGTSQAVRVDFFNPFGAPLNLSSGSSVPSIVIPANGVATISATAP